MATNRLRSGRRTGAVALATSALLCLAVSPAFAHTNVTSSTDARNALLDAEQVGAERDEVDELDELEQAEAGDEAEAGDDGDHAAPRIQGRLFVEKKADTSAPHRQATKSDGQDDDQGDDNDDQADDNDDQADKNDDHEESGDTGESGDGEDSGESGD